MTVPHIVLASGSASRRAMLEAAGVSFQVHPASIDEDVMTGWLLATKHGAGPDDVAVMLARAKARAVANFYPDHVVIGSDQVLSVGSELLTKPGSAEGVRATLRKLRGRTHTLHAAVAVIGPAGRAWEHIERAKLEMRDLSEATVDAYVAAHSDEVKESVGAYHIEGFGVQLFASIEGDQFTIRGMPLLPLLTELRRRGALPE